MTDNNKLVAEAIRAGATPEGFKEIELDWLEFKVVGDYAQGKLITKTRQRMQKGNDVGKYTIIQANNKRASFLGSTKLDDLLAGVPLGAEVFIQLTGIQIQENQNEMKLFKVFVK